MQDHLRLNSLRAAVVAGAFLAVAPAMCQVVVADNLNRAVAGTPNTDLGPLVFVPGNEGNAYALQCTVLKAAVRYSFPAWQNPQGTLECRFFPTTFASGYNFLTIQWNSSFSDPGNGYVGDFNVDPNHLSWVAITQSGEQVLTSAGPLPLAQWSHVAVSWSASGTSMYVNGVE